MKPLGGSTANVDNLDEIEINRREQHFVALNTSLKYGSLVADNTEMVEQTNNCN